MALRVTLAGRVGIEVDGGEVAAAGLGRPGRLALAYLTCERHRSVPRDELAEVLWGDERPQSADQMLRGVAFKLRGMLSGAGLDPTEALSTAAGAFRLFLPADATVDVEEAAAGVASAEASLAAGYAGAARAQAAAALAVAARPFAPTTAGAWVERRQAELAELGLRALEALARAALAESDWAGAIAAAEEVVARQPFRESAYLVLMDAHAGAGNRGEALRAYSRCRGIEVDGREVTRPVWGGRGAWPWYADALLRCPGGDHDASLGLGRIAADDANELGMTGLAEDARARLECGGMRQRSIYAPRVGFTPTRYDS